MITSSSTQAISKGYCLWREDTLSLQAALPACQKPQRGCSAALPALATAGGQRAPAGHCPAQEPAGPGAALTEGAAPAAARHCCRMGGPGRCPLRLHLHSLVTPPFHCSLRQATAALGYGRTVATAALLLEVCTPDANTAQLRSLGRLSILTCYGACKAQTGANCQERPTSVRTLMCAGCKARALAGVRAGPR